LVSLLQGLLFATRHSFFDMTVDFRVPFRHMELVHVTQVCIQGIRAFP
jgi:hypothetical protein